MAIVDTMITGHLLVDFEMYDYWLQGYTPHEVVMRLSKSFCQFDGVNNEMILGDVIDQFNNFLALERYLAAPHKINDQLYFQIPFGDGQKLINKYYEIDEGVARELLGKKLSSRNRKDLDDTSDETHIALKSCRRQFDNIKRVYRATEDLPGSLIENIEKLFRLPNDLAKTYAAIIFMADNRFETSRKRLSSIKLDSFVHCALDMMKHWTPPAFNNFKEDQMDLHRDFTLILRESRVLLEKDGDISEHKKNFLSHIGNKLSDTSAELMFHKPGKQIVSTASNLYQSKEVRDFFVDIVDKVVVPGKELGLTQGEMSAFLSIFTSTASATALMTNNNLLREYFDRYMLVVTGCILRLYRSIIL